MFTIGLQTLINIFSNLKTQIMLTKKIRNIGYFLLASAISSAIIVSCSKNKDNVQTLPGVQSSKPAGDLQKIEIDFSTATLETRSGITVSPQGVSGTDKAFLVTAPVAISGWDKDAPFVSFHGSWEGSGIEDNTLQPSISVSADGQKWSEWYPVHFDADGENTASRKVSGPVDVDVNTRFVKFRAAFSDAGGKASLQKAVLYCFNPGHTSPEQKAEIARLQQEIDNAANNRANPALCAKPSFTSRTTWGARAATSSPSYTTVNFLIVHHEDGPNTSTDWAARVRSIQNYHMNTNGWSDIGYNYLVDPNGVPYEGRGGGENVIGAHFCGKNGNTMGICMLGNYSTVRPTNNAEYALKRILAWKAKQRGLNVLGTAFHVDRTINRVTGHQAGCATSCPGTALWNDLPRLRNDIQNNFIAQCP
jgi:N-acetylmuramoyl-L-alanine amidase